MGTDGTGQFLSGSGPEEKELQFSEFSGEKNTKAFSPNFNKKYVCMYVQEVSMGKNVHNFFPISLSFLL